MTERRPGLSIVLVGAAVARASGFPLGTEVVAVPRPDAEGDLHLRALLAARRAGPADARHALVAATATLAEVLDLRVELLEVGMSGALRARAEPGAEPGAPVRIAAVEAPSAVLGLVDDDAALDRVEAWATLGVDRARLRDRLAELRLAPWADLGGDGALLRAAALRAVARAAGRGDRRAGRLASRPRDPRRRGVVVDPGLRRPARPCRRGSTTGRRPGRPRFRPPPGPAGDHRGRRRTRP